MLNHQFSFRKMLTISVIIGTTLTPIKLMAEEIEFVIEGYITKVEDNDPNVNAMLNEYFSIGDLMTGIISYETDTPRDEWNSRVDQNFYWLGYSPDFWPSFGEMKFVINGVTFDQDPKRYTDPDPPLCRASYEAFVHQSYSVLMLAANGGSTFNGWKTHSLVAFWGNRQDVTPIVLPTSVNIGDMNYANWRIKGNGDGTGGNTGEFEGVITSITLASNPPLNCVGFDTPFDNALFIKNKAKVVIPVKIVLYDEDGFLITDQDVTALPVINVKYSSANQGDGVVNIENKEFTRKSSEGNAFTFNSDTDQWEYQLGTKQFSEPGTYTVSVISGDGIEYTIDGDCIQTFERLQKRR